MLDYQEGVILFYMNLWGDDNHHDHNKGPDHAPCAFQKLTL